MTSTLDESYFKWLYSQVEEVRSKAPAHTYWRLFEILHNKEFIWLIPNDDNRIADGKYLRVEFLNFQRIDTSDRSWMDADCSFLEMLIALSRRLAFEAEGGPREWFRHLLETLELADLTDAVPIPEDEVNDILDTVIWRTYRPNGEGGLFPLREPSVDQTGVEIWYQLNAYLIENDY